MLIVSRQLILLHNYPWVFNQCSLHCHFYMKCLWHSPLYLIFLVLITFALYDMTFQKCIKDYADIDLVGAATVKVMHL